MMMRDPKLQAKRDRGDLATAVVVAALAIGFLLYSATRRIMTLFSTPGAITVQTPLDEQSVTMDIGDGVAGTIHMGTLVVHDVNVVSIVCLVVAIVIGAIGLIAAAIFSAALCRRLLRGDVFDRENTRLTFSISLALLIAGVGEIVFQNMGLNGVFAAAGGEFTGQTSLMLQAVPLYVAAIAVGVLVIVFRRGADLRRETEGLV